MSPDRARSPSSRVVYPEQSMRWRVIQALFALSGACALAYEVVWGRWLVTVLGGSAMATSAVLTAYMGGLALGAWLFGGYSRRSAAPLRDYAFVELGVGLLALAFPLLAERVLGMPPAVRGAAAMVFLLAPTLLMGGTIPLVMAWSAGERLRHEETLGRLYGLNTVGAAVGCLGAGFVLIPKLGLQLSNIVAVMGNLVVALVVLFVHRGTRSPVASGDNADAMADATTDATTEIPAPTPARTPAREEPRALDLRVLHLLAFLSGFATLGLEVVWIRLLRITLGSTTYVFTLVVASYVLGIGLGGLRSAKAAVGTTGAAGSDEEVPRRLAQCQLALVGLLALQFALLPKTPALFNALRAAVPGWDGALLGSAVLCVVALVPVASVSGLTFPLLGRLYLARGHLGRQTGVYYAINTLGAVAGSLLTALVLVPTLGSARTFALLAGLGVVGLVVYTRHGWSRPPRTFAAASLAVVSAGVALAVARPGWTPAYLAHGAYLAPRKERVETVVFAEGRSSTVLVESFGGQLGMAVDGKPEASTAYVDRANQILLGHLPALLAPRVDRALVVGLGSGMTLGMLTQHSPKELELVELEARMADAARCFGDWNHHVMERGGFRMIVDDGLNYLASTDRRYDVITSDPIQPFFRGAAGLYTTEFFRRASERLATGGVMAHWLPLANMTVAEFRLIVRTFIAVFPNARLYWTGGFADTLLVGSNGAFEGGVNPAAFERAKGDLQGIYIDEAAQMDSLLIADRDVLLYWSGHGRKNTLAFPRLEFSSPRSVYANTVDGNMAELLVMRRAMDRDDPAWRLGDLVLAYRAELEHMGDAVTADRILLTALGCPEAAAQCAPARRSGLLRRILFERALAQGDRALTRAAAEDKARHAWWSGRLPPTMPVNPGLVRALESYEHARALAALAEPALPDEVAKVAQRAQSVATAFPPDTAEALRARALAAP